ncbi:DUF998 domain-containing protein [Microbacterium sp. M28]|uniref:DUF998 domain-containing protein n=1 Tax=Microbacterium sp. M28 TaxID=2962064 RepID=UPI0021F47830|nr:DUF998 domain-containing protein [Microbacterium sp. M28]UYO96221.1 DUF998 domain-containing protein [Microbacterium sp. M28]
MHTADTSRVSDWVNRFVRRPGETTISLEAVALLVGAGFFIVAFPISFVVFWGRTLDITGPGSIGTYAAIGGAVVAILAVALARIGVRSRGERLLVRSDGLALPDVRVRWYESAAIALAYAVTALLGWEGIAVLLSDSFTGAPVFAFPGAILVAVAFALTAYICYLSAATLTPMSLSLVLAVFLVVGAFASMLTATDPLWWQDNLSALGMSTNSSAWIFNGTLIVAGIIVTTIGRYATAQLPVETPEQQRGRRFVRIAMALIGVFLACVGIFPVDEFFLLHNTVATGMAVAFAAVVIALPWLLPTIARVFVVLGYVYVAVIALLGVFFATGYYNLTAVELIAAVLIFSWIIVFLRTASVGMPVADDIAASQAVTA